MWDERAAARDHHEREVGAGQLADQAGVAGSGLSGCGQTPIGGRAPEELSAAGVCRRGAAAPGSAGQRGGGQGLPAAGRRLRRELRGILRQQHPRHLPRAAADGRGPDLRGCTAGGEGRPHRRPVRQAALRPDRDHRRRRAAVLSRRHRQRHGVQCRGAQARPGAPGAELQPIGRDAEPAARLRPGRFRRPAQGAPLEPRVRGGQPARRSATRSWRRA